MAAALAGIAAPPTEARIDGVGVFERRGRVNVRFSGTEPNLLRVMLEGAAHNTLAQVVEGAVRLCQLVAAASGTSQPRIDIVDCVTGAPIQV
ncbi:MAG: hypothetical protein ACK4P1_09700 [Aggregatilineales bacterium]